MKFIIFHDFCITLQWRSSIFSKKMWNHFWFRQNWFLCMKMHECCPHVISTHHKNEVCGYLLLYIFISLVWTKSNTYQTKRIPETEIWGHIWKSNRVHVDERGRHSCSKCRFPLKSLFSESKLWKKIVQTCWRIFQIKISLIRPFQNFWIFKDMEYTNAVAL